MSQRYKGAVISATPPTTSTTSAPGAWTLQQQMQAQGAGTWPFGGPFNYIEDVFSTYVYTGTSGAQSINNGIDLSGKGGLVWTKLRNITAINHVLNDTSQGASKFVYSNANNGATTDANGITSFNSNGYSVGTGTSSNWNYTGGNLVSWTFRKQAKFFDVVTYTGTGSNTTIAHNLGSVPGCIMVKRTDTTGNWQVYHNSLTSAAYSIELNSSTGEASAPTVWNSTAPTSTVFSVGTATTVNASGGTYVAYLFAHNAGGFGLAGTDNVISCGSYNGNSSTTGPIITLGYEPQWLLIRDTSAGSWFMFDVMRGLSYTSANYLAANSANQEQANTQYYNILATGFQPAIDNTINVSGSKYIYIAIRRGPMKTPTSGTSVFAPTAATTSGGGTVRTIGFPADLSIGRARTTASNSTVNDRLRGYAQNGVGSLAQNLYTESTGAESNASPIVAQVWNTTFQDTDLLASGASGIWWNFRRAPGFMDVVCYTGTGVARTVTHNLGVAPELMIVKLRSNAGEAWTVWNSTIAAANAANFLWLNSTSAIINNSGRFNSTAPTSTVFTVGTDISTNNSGYTYVAYLFASRPGVSKVGSYTGTGATQTISCGFAARFVLIKRTDSTGDWWVWDTARGMVAGTDPRLGLNISTAETNANWVYTDASGFQIVTTDATVNASGGSYIYLAIA